MTENRVNSKSFWPIMTGLALVFVFLSVNYFIESRHQRRVSSLPTDNELEILPDSLKTFSRRLVFYDFESGTPEDSSVEVSSIRHSGKKSFSLNSKSVYSPGIRVRFSDLNPGSNSWIRTSAFVWFDGLVSEAKCSLVTTCFHNGVNYKYRFLPLEAQPLKTGKWNRVNIDYHIPSLVNQDDLIQVYFWYRGNSEIFIDDMEIIFYQK